MSNLLNILRNKPGSIASVTRDTSVADCIRLMKEWNIGSVLILDGKQVVGIFTERIAVWEIYLNLKELDLEQEPVSRVMDSLIVIVNPKTSVEEAMELFTTRRTRHLIVNEDDGSLAGVVSIGDVTKWLIDNQRNEIGRLADYIAGHPIS